MCPPKKCDMPLANEILSFKRCNASIQALQKKYPKYLIKDFDISLYSLKTLKSRITDILDDAHKSNFKNQKPLAFMVFTISSTTLNEQETKNYYLAREYLVLSAVDFCLCNRNVGKDVKKIDPKCDSRFMSIFFVYKNESN